jgi:RimJ/RimL family protein N-acetyltransferase
MDDIIVDKNYKLKIITYDSIELLKSLCEKCIDYYGSYYGQYNITDVAKEIFEDIPPNKEYIDKFVFGVFNDDELIGIIDIVRDFPIDEEWIIGLMLINPNERKNKLGTKIHNSLIKWATNLGAKSFRIGVIKDNYVAMKFWSGLGYKKIKEVDMDLCGKKNIVYVMRLNLNI